MRTHAHYRPYPKSLRHTSVLCEEGKVLFVTSDLNSLGDFATPMLDAQDDETAKNEECASSARCLASSRSPVLRSMSLLPSSVSESCDSFAMCFCTPTLQRIRPTVCGTPRHR